MKLSSMSVALKPALLSLAVAMPLSAIAQSAIQRAAEPYITKPEIQFAIATPVAAPPAVAPGVPALSLVPVVSFEIEKGKHVDEQLRAYAKQSGWNLVWQAPDYVLDQRMTLQGDFEASLLSFLKGANEAGTRLRAVFYRGNKTVRVMEF